MKRAAPKGATTRQRRRMTTLGPPPIPMTALQRRIAQALVAAPLAQSSVLAQRLGCHPNTVRLVRRLLGEPPQSNSRPRIDWAAQPLGQVSDHEVARRLGCHPVSVREARVRLGIAPWKAVPRGA